MEVIDVELERKEILKRYRKLLRAAKPILKDGDAKLIKKAFFTSMEAHKGMRRKSGEPYIYHPLAVAQIAVDEIGLGTTSIVSALLHDVVEDTELEVGDIARDFGPKVAKIIDGLTKISGVFEYGTSQQAENFRKMLLTLSDDVRVILIKLADRLHNMRTLGSMARNSQLKIASEPSTSTPRWRTGWACTPSRPSWKTSTSSTPSRRCTARSPTACARRRPPAINSSKTSSRRWKRNWPGTTLTS
jgi:GTP pyrophosphokinase